MPQHWRRGFTLIEMLIVVVLIGILAAIAIPKFRATKDKAKLATVKTDLRNLRTAQEAYFATSARYTTKLAANLFQPSKGNTVSLSATTASFTATVTNASIGATPKQCKVTVGTKTIMDGMMSCS